MFRFAMVSALALMGTGAQAVVFMTPPSPSITYDFETPSTTLPNFASGAKLVKVDDAHGLSLELPTQKLERFFLSFLYPGGAYRVHNIGYVPQFTFDAISLDNNGIRNNTLNETWQRFSTGPKEGARIALTGRVFIDNVNVSYLARPVPEPETWALLIGGFGMMGAAARQRRRYSSLQVG